MSEIKFPLVSIIMNCYNGEKFLKDALDSVLAQTYLNWELIFWDNQSNDKSTTIFKNYYDPRLKYFLAQEHTLLYEARNYATEKASGDYFAFLDVDDWWLPSKLEKQIPLFVDTEVGLVCSNFLVMNEFKGKSKKYWNNKKPTGWILDYLLKDYFVGLLTIIVRRTTFEELTSVFNPNYHIIGDFDLTIQVAKDWKIGCIQEPTAYFRFHGENESVKHQDLYIRELEYWRDEMMRDTSISKQKGFVYHDNFLQYQKSLLYLHNKEYHKLWKSIIKMPFSYRLFKLLLIILLENVLFIKVQTK